MRSICLGSNEDFRNHLKFENGNRFSVTQCQDFFVCAHSNTCKAYKDRHCKAQLALLSKLSAAGVKVETC